MARQLQIDPSQVEDLGIIRDLGKASLRAAADVVNRLNQTPLRAEVILASLKEILPNRDDAAESLVRQALALSGLMRHFRLSSDEIGHTLRSAVEGIAEWNEDERRSWFDVEPIFLEFVCSRPVRLVAKAIDLSYDYANLFQRARILTDIRPLFAQGADQIEGAVVSNTLRLWYDSSDGEHELSIAMDEGDIEQLSLQCERALIKARTARGIMVETAKIPTIVTGERHDA